MKKGHGVILLDENGSISRMKGHLNDRPQLGVILAFFSPVGSQEERVISK